MSENAPNTPSYYAIIPADVRYSSEVSNGAKLLYGEITALCNKEGYCWASNGYFAKLYNNDTKTISRWVQELVEALFIKTVVDKKAGNQRRIYLSPKITIPILKKDDTPIPKIAEYNNTVRKFKNNILSPKDLELDLKERKTKFFQTIKDWKEKHKGKYPPGLYGKFFAYWSELNELEGANKMRFESQSYFEIGRRLATFWTNTKDAERQEMKKEEEASKTQLDIFAGLVEQKSKF